MAKIIFKGIANHEIEGVNILFFDVITDAAETYEWFDYVSLDGTNAQTYLDNSIGLYISQIETQIAEWVAADGTKVYIDPMTKESTIVKINKIDWVKSSPSKPKTKIQTIEEEVSYLKAKIKTSEDTITSLDLKLKTTEEKITTLEDKIKTVEEKVK